MKTLILSLGFGVALFSDMSCSKMLSNLTEFGSNSKFRFGTAVRFQEKDADHFCNGQIRNPIALGYYQVDKVACHYKTMGKPSSPILSTAGWDLNSSMIVHEKDMTWLFTQHVDEATGYTSYLPLEGMDKEHSFYLDKERTWRMNETGKIAPKAEVDSSKFDKLVYDDKFCEGAVDGYLWAKSAYSKIDSSKVPFVKDCFRVHPQMKNKKLSKSMDTLLTNMWGGKEKYRNEVMKAQQKS